LKIVTEISIGVVKCAATTEEKKMSMNSRPVVPDAEIKVNASGVKGVSN